MKTKNESDSKPELKNKYIRSVIKLGNSKAITFPQDWTLNADLDEKSEVSLYPLDRKTIVIRAFDKEKPKTTFTIDSNKWAVKLIKQAIISAYKLNISEVYLKYTDKNQEILNKLLIELRSEIIGIDFKNNIDKKEFFIHFLLDTSKISFKEVLMDLSNVLKTLINNVIEGKNQNSNQLILDEIDRKYSLGRRILITGLSDYPISKGYGNFPMIRYLGDRVILLYIRDFINEALNLQLISKKELSKYSEILVSIPNLLIDLVADYENVDLDSISKFQEFLIEYAKTLKKIQFQESNIEEQHVRNTIKYYLSCFESFFDIGMTRLIESEIGMI